MSARFEAYSLLKKNESEGGKKNGSGEGKRKAGRGSRGQVIIKDQHEIFFLRVIRNIKGILKVLEVSHILPQLRKIL